MPKPQTQDAKNSHFREDLTGTTVGRFSVQIRLGSGGMGEVYRAQDTKLKRPVALKRMAPELRADERYRRRFLQEAERASALSYEHIAGVYDVVEENGEIFLVMEYVEGQTLRQRMQQPLSPRELVPIALQCAEALVGAAKKGIVHHDIKPENIMLTPVGQAKILDFGVAKRLVRDDEGTTTTGAESTVGGLSGTVAYMAPEVLLQRESDTRSDIFSLGVVLHEALSGRHPFRAETFIATSDRILHEFPVPPRQLNPQVPAELERIANKMLAKDPEERYATAADLVVDLRALERTLARRQERPASRPRLLPLSLSRWRHWVAAALALGLLALPVWFFWPQTPAQRIPVAVMPFGNHTGNEQLDDLGLTLADILTAELDASPNLRPYAYRQLIEILGGFSTNQMASPAAVQAVANYSNSEFVVIPGMYAVGDNLRLQAEFRDTAADTPAGVVKVERRLATSAADTYYSMLGDLAKKIDDHFKGSAPGGEYQPRPPASRPRTPTAAFHLTEGKTALARGEYAEALAAFERAAEEDPDHALTYTWMGHIYGLLHYDTKAREFSEKAARLITPRTPLQDAYFIEACRAESKYDFATAEARYLELVRFNPDQAVWYANLAKVYARQDLFPKAIAHYQTALQRDSNYVAAYQELATLYRRTGDLQQATAQTEKALQLYRLLKNREGEANVLLERSEIARVRGEYDKAQEYAGQGMEIFRELDQDVGMSTAALRLGNLRFHQRDYEGAREHWRQVVSTAGEIRNNAYVVTALMNIGVSYEYENDLGQTIQYYQQALSKQWPALWEQAQVKSNLAVIYIQYGINPEQGMTLAQEAMETFRQVGDRNWQATTHLYLGYYYSNRAHYRQAMDHIHQAQAVFRSLQQKESLASAMREAGRVHFIRNQYEQARQAFSETLAVAQEFGDTYGTARSRIFLGWTYSRLGDTARAGPLLQDGLQGSRQEDFEDLLLEAYTALGELHWQTGRAQQARQNFQQAADRSTGLGVFEHSVEARSNFGRLEAEGGRLSDALLHCRRAADQARKLQATHVLARAVINLAEVHLAREEHPQALEVLEEVLAEETLGLEFRARAYHVRARALEALGESEEAQAAFQQARATISELQRQLSPEHQESFAARPDIQPLLR